MANILDSPIQVPRLLRIHWLWALVLSFVTCGVFGVVLFIVQAYWVRRVQGRTLPLVLACLVGCMNLLRSFLFLVERAKGWSDITNGYSSLLSAVLWIASVYILRGALTEEPIGLSLGWIMPLLYGPIYFQYHIQDYGSTSSSGRPLGLSA